MDVAGRPQGAAWPDGQGAVGPEAEGERARLVAADRCGLLQRAVGEPVVEHGRAGPGYRLLLVDALVSLPFGKERLRGEVREEVAVRREQLPAAVVARRGGDVPGFIRGGGVALRNGAPWRRRDVEAEGVAAGVRDDADAVGGGVEARWRARVPGGDARSTGRATCAANADRHEDDPETRLQVNSVHHRRDGSSGVAYQLTTHPCRRILRSPGCSSEPCS